MKILAIMGSPRRGNSYQITRLIRERLQELGDVEFEYLFLKELHLERCLGCAGCILNGEDTCPLKDDRAGIEAKMLAADGIILVTPVYNFHVTGYMKDFIDRFTYMVHRPRLFKKKTMIVVVRGNIFRSVPKYLAKVARAWGLTVINQVNEVEFDISQAAQEKPRQRVHRAATVFWKAMAAKRLPALRLGDLVWFRFWQVTSQTCNYDLNYWNQKGWYERRYYYDARINPFKNFIAALIGKMVKTIMRRTVKDVQFK